MQRAIVVAIAVLALSSSLRCGGEPSATDEQNSAAGAGGSGGSPPLGAVPRPAYAYPSADPDVCFVPTADKLELQNVLDNVSGACPSHKLRLEGGDYRTGGLPELVIRSGYELYGLPGIDQTGAPPTSVPPIRIAGGTERAVLSTLRTDIELEPSDEVTRFNLIRRIEYGTVRAGSGVRLESNLFLGLNFTNIEIDTSQAGFARFNRFIYTRVQTNLQTHLRLIGDPAKQSYGNTILWFQSLGAGASGLVIQDQTDLALLDVGGEVWASGQNGVIDDDDKRSPLLRATTTPGSAPARVFVLNLNGGNILGWPTGLAEFGVDELFAIGLNQTGPLGSPRIVLGETNRRFVSIHQSMGDLITAPHDPNPWLSADEQSSVIRDEATQRELRLVESHVESPERKLYLDGVAPQQAAIRAAISPPARVGEPWERPRLDPIPDPVGPNWRAGLAEARDPNGALDSSAYIQGLIDSPSIGYLPEGVWYISQPLRFRRGKGLRGAGMGKTAIVAKSAEIDMIINDDQISFPGTFQDGVDVAYATDVPIYLMDLTLQGGKNGIHHAKETAGDLAQFTSMLISHVQFRELSESGIFIDRVYAWDTNLVDNVIFLDCKQSAIKQRVEQHTGEAPGLGYMDKNFFYESQFIGSQIALDQQGGRASGGNVYASSLFRDNGIVALQVAHSADLFANSDFIDNGGSEAQPMISNNGWVDLVSCSVHADKAQVLFRGLFDVEGSSFFRGSASTVQLVSSSQPNNALYMTNSTLDFPVGGTIAQGLLANVAFAADDQRFFAHTHFIAGNAVTTVVDGEAESPRPQLLVGTRFD